MLNNSDFDEHIVDEFQSINFRMLFVFLKKLNFQTKGKRGQLGQRDKTVLNISSNPATCDPDGD